MPWGLIGVVPANRFFDSQKSLNKLLTGALQYNDLIKKIGSHNFSQSMKVFENFGIRAENMEIGRPQVLLADDNVIILATATKAEVNGKDYEEISVETTTHMQDFLLKFVIFFNADEVVPTPALAGELAKLMALTKSWNE